jgi:CubicO group peptidase (beta-lactamase class C family)
MKYVDDIIMNTLIEEKIINFIEDEMEALSFPGAALLVTKNGKPIIQYNLGTYCNCQQRDSIVDVTTVHMLYSFSKMISATAIAIAKQKKLIDYDVPICEYIPEFCGKEREMITIRHLLTHSAGLSNCTLESVLNEEEWSQALQTCCEYKVEWAPGSQTEYHALAGMFLAAESVRRRAGTKTWDDICREWIFSPLGADSLTFKVSDSKMIAITPQPEILPGQISSICLGHPGAGCFGKIEDVIKILQLHLNHGVWNGIAIIDREHISEMHSVQYENCILEAEKSNLEPKHEPWGLGMLIKRNLKDHGFGLGNLTGETAFGHAGIDTVLAVADPSHQLAVAFISTDSLKTNTARIRNLITDFAVEIASEN